ncbi:MAG: peptidoglycan-binding protein [Leptolyngbya sp. BL-A-14]
MVIPVALSVSTCIDCPSSAQPPQVLAKAPRLDVASVSTKPALQTAYDEALQSTTPDTAIGVEWSARSRESDPAIPLMLGSRGTAVARLQARLARLGYAVSEADGIFGPQTQAAVMQFQQANGLIIDGIVDANSWAKLNAVITQAGLVPSMPLPQLRTVESDASAVPVATPASLIVSKPIATPSTLRTSPFSQKDGWIVVLVIVQGCGWLVILQGLNKELVLLTGRSLLPGKKQQWLFSLK